MPFIAVPPRGRSLAGSLYKRVETQRSTSYAAFCVPAAFCTSAPGGPAEGMAEALPDIEICILLSCRLHV